MRITGGQVVTMNARREVRAADILVRGDRIEALADPGRLPPAEPGEETLDATGRTVIPGLVQGHVHLCQTLFRNRCDDLELLDWLRLRVWPYEGAHDAESLAASARLGLAELIRGGTTAVLDMGTLRHTERLFEEAAIAGIRYTGGKVLMDRRAGQPDALLEETAPALKESDDLARAWHGKAGGRLRYAYCPRFVLTCTEELLREADAMARAGGMLVHTHASESKGEVAICRQTREHDNVEYFQAIDAIGAHLALAHCVWVSGDELYLMADHQVKVLHCPGSNLKLASGIAPVPEMLELGIPVSIGADGAPCNNNLDAFVEMRLAALIQKPRLGPRAMSALQVFEMATLGGAKCLGLEREIGSIEPGKKADLALLDLEDARSSPAGDVYSRIVYSAQSAQVRAVVCDGKVLLREGELVTIDGAAARAKAAEELEKLLRRL